MLRILHRPIKIMPVMPDESNASQGLKKRGWKKSIYHKLIVTKVMPVRFLKKGAGKNQFTIN
jgi:hypothetical protein